MKQIHSLPGGWLLLAALALGLAPQAARAAVTPKDVQVVGRVLGFLSNPLSGDVRLGIVYDPANAASAADEQAMAGLLGSGLQVASVNLIPVPVPISNLAAAKVDVYFLVAGLGPQAASVGAQAAAQKAVCVTTDLTAVQAGSCAVAVQSDPKVQITVNKAALAGSGLAFGSAFMLMITEI